MAAPHLLYIGLALVGIVFAVSRHGINAAIVNNACWALLNAAVFIPFITASLPEKWRGKNSGLPFHEDIITKPSSRFTILASKKLPPKEAHYSLHELFQNTPKTLEK